MIYDEGGLYLIELQNMQLMLLLYKEIKQSRTPLRFAGISTCFGKELGAHGKDTKGILEFINLRK